ncbi:hypothetical protein [Nocardiopsis ansamitocini]|nr:hypothetical protein [Nocardiopsis ansamitocini]
MCDRSTPDAGTGDDNYIFDPGSLTTAQIMGDACAICYVKWPRPRDPVGALPDGTEVYGCAECAHYMTGHDAAMFDHAFAAH